MTPKVPGKPATLVGGVVPLATRRGGQNFAHSPSHVLLPLGSDAKTYNVRPIVVVRMRAAVVFTGAAARDRTPPRACAAVTVRATSAGSRIPRVREIRR